MVGEGRSLTDMDAPVSTASHIACPLLVQTHKSFPPSYPYEWGLQTVNLADLGGSLVPLILLRSWIGSGVSHVCPNILLLCVHFYYSDYNVSHCFQIYFLSLGPSILLQSALVSHNCDRLIWT